MKSKNFTFVIVKEVGCYVYDGYINSFKLSLLGTTKGLYLKKIKQLYEE